MKAKTGCLWTIMTPRAPTHTEQLMKQCDPKHDGIGYSDRHKKNRITFHAQEILRFIWVLTVSAITLMRSDCLFKWGNRIRKTTPIYRHFTTILYQHGEERRWRGQGEQVPRLSAWCRQRSSSGDKCVLTSSGQYPATPAEGAITHVFHPLWNISD